MNDDHPLDHPKTDEQRIDAAVRFMRRVSEVDSVNRANAIYWRKFRFGEQWPAEIQNSRNLEQRPCITVNKTDVYCLSVENQQRQQRPRIKVDPTNGQATKRVADVIQGMLRHIETTRGGAELAYDKAFECAVTEGVGYYRILGDYVRQDSFEQELYFSAIDDPLSVYFDDNSVMPDGSDAEEVLIVTDMPKASFRESYPDADDGAGFRPRDMGGYTNGDWLNKDTIRVAEYYVVEKKQQRLYKLSNGQSVWAEDMPPEEVRDDMFAHAGVHILESRDGCKKSIKWFKLTAVEVLESRDLPGRWIPVVPVYGRKTIIDGKVRKSGLIKNAIGPQQMSNFWKTAATESVALAPKPKWLIAEGQDDGHENEWARANVSVTATLRYRQKDADGEPAPPPSRIQPEPPPEGVFSMIQSVDNDLSSVLGIIEPAQRIAGNVSGKALQAERLQSDQNTFHLYDMLTCGIAFGGRIALDLLPVYYPEPGRVVRIVGADGISKTTTINQPHPKDPTKIINDISVGQYDIVMDTGPGYNTKRQEAVASMMPLFEAHEDLMKIAGDVLFRSMDFPGSEVIADRMAAANPLSTVDDESDVPPAAQMKIKQLTQQLQQATQAIQAKDMLLKDRHDVEGLKEAAETDRTKMEIASKEKIAGLSARTKQEDTHTRALSNASNHEIDAARDIILQGKDHAHELRTMEQVADREDSQIQKAETA